MPHDESLTKQQKETLARLERASREILETYQRINEYLNSHDEFRAAVGLAQVAAGLTSWDHES